MSDTININNDNTEKNCTGYDIVIDSNFSSLHDRLINS